MAQITKTVDKTLINGSEVFIYTINAAYSGLSVPAQEGKITDFFPSKIKYILPPVGGQIKSIIETPVQGGTLVTFNLGSVNSGTSLSFTIACHFGPGRVDNDSFINNADLIADNVVVAQGSAPIVNLKLDDEFTLRKFSENSTIVNANDELTFVLSLTNYNDPGATITNVIVTDVLPPQLIPVTTFVPIGNDFEYNDYSDPTADGLTGTWDENTLVFEIPKYCGARYDIKFKATVSEDVIPGQSFINNANWTMNGSDRNEDSLYLSVYDPFAAGFKLLKLGSRTTISGAPIDYELRNKNDGNVVLNNYELEDIIPSEIDITAFHLNASTGLENYSIYMSFASSPDDYVPIITNIENGSYPYMDLTPLITKQDRLAKIKLTAEKLLVDNSDHSLFIHGTTNSTAILGESFTNDAVAKSGNITQTKQWKTLINGASDLTVQKNISPVQPAYYPLEEFDVILSGCTMNTICIDPILSDLMPFGLRYVIDSEYFLYHEKSTGIIYDSRQSGFPVPLPTREIIPNFSNTDSTLLRWNFSDFILPTSCRIEVIFKAFVDINHPNSFVNKGYMGITGDNVFTVYDEIIDTLDVDGDGLTDDRVSCKEVSGIILSSSEFSLKKLVKGQNDLEYSNSGITVDGGKIDYRLQITNIQNIDLKNIEMIDILPFVGDTGVILTSQQRGSQFDVYATSIVTAKIVNVLGTPIDPTTDILVEYSTSNDPKRFDELGNAIGTGDWSLTPPENITTLRSIKVTTGPTVTLKPYNRLIIDFGAKAPVGVPTNKTAYNSYAVRANKITDNGTEPLLPTEPNKVEVTIAESKLGSIGSFVWLDENQNGLYDQGESGINGITIQLYDDKGTLLKTTVTTNNSNGEPGYYLFNDLEDGVYQVKFISLGDYYLTQQKAEQPNGSKPNQVTGFTDHITVSNAEQILDINAGLIKCNPPVINAKDKCIHLGDAFNPLQDITATDCKGKDITDKVIVIFNSVDSSTVGIYSVTYSVTDSKNQKTTLTIKVVVCQNSPLQQAISNIYKSVELEKIALSNILKAERKKIKKAKKLNLSTDEMQKVTDSVNDTKKSISKLKMVLESKLKLLEDANCSKDCCDDQ